MPIRIADLEVGSSVKFGSYSVGGEEPHKIKWVKVHHDCTLLTKYIEDQCAFDAKEPFSESRDRRNYGCNRYSVSNINAFLNSEKPQWFTPQTATDTPPDNEFLYGNTGGYRNKPGFLHLFKPWELDAILCSKIKTKLCNIDYEANEYKEYETNFTRVFLPAWANISGHGTSEGRSWAYFSEHRNDRSAILSSQCFKFGCCDTKPDNENEWWYYFLRTPYEDYSTVKIIDCYGDTSWDYANRSFIGIRPALLIDPDTLVSDETDEVGCYEVLEPAQDNIEIPEDEFFTLIKS